MAMTGRSEPVNILLVDDQPGKLLSYEAILSELGENLIKANSGREALEHLLKTDITVVLMDVSMPELDGFELAEIIRQHPRFQKTAIIFVSAVHLSDLDQLKGYESGAVDYVSVPVIPELLRAKVSVFAELYRKTRDSERLTRELEHRVAARTAELEASMARQLALTEQLREADRRKDEFLALLAHELRNPARPGRERRQHHAHEGVRRSRAPLVPGRHRTPGLPADPAGGRSARRVAHHAGQDQAPPRAAGYRRRHRRRGGSQPADHRDPRTMSSS